MGEPRAVNPLVEQFCRGGVPRELRLMAAQGALPLKPGDLVELLHFLLSDRDGDVRAAAGKTLEGLPAEELLPILKDRETPPRVLAWGIAPFRERELREAALQNPSTPDEAIEKETPGLPEALAELVVINQTRLLRRTTLLEALESNPNLNNDQRRRLRELRETFKIGEQPAPAPPQAPSPAAPEPEAAQPAPEEPPAEEPPITEGEALVRYLTEEEQKEAEKISAVQKLFRLTTAEKVVTALRGTREERGILIRDPNRLVSTAVLGSPRLTDTEVEAFAGMKSVSDEVLRKIGTHREWTKRYAIVLNLVKNPRTPLAISIGMVPRLNPRDLKLVAFDRNVPEVIRTQAQRFVRQTVVGPREKKQ